MTRCRGTRRGAAKLTVTPDPPLVSHVLIGRSRVTIAMERRKNFGSNAQARGILPTHPYKPGRATVQLLGLCNLYGAIRMPVSTSFGLAEKDLNKPARDLAETTCDKSIRSPWAWVWQILPRRREFFQLSPLRHARRWLARTSR